MSEKVWTVDTFVSRVRDDVGGICKDNGWTYDNEQQRGFAFQQWIKDLICEHEGIDDDEAATVFTTNDLKIDVAIEDYDQKVLYLIQTKFLAPNQKKPLDETEVNDFFSRHELLLSGKWVERNASEELLEYVNDYKSRIDNGWQVHWYFVGTGVASVRCKELVVEKEASVNQDYAGIFFNLIDLYSLKEFFIESESLEQKIPERVEFAVPQDRWIIKDDPRRTLIAVLKANAIVALYKKEREKIFAYNIRSFLGRKGINKDIIATASDDPEDFFYFNNGISAVCTRFEFDRKSGKFTGHNFQVINGAQTIGSLKNVKTLSSEVEIMIRITEGGSVKTEKGFNADVIRFNNTQNIIKSSDFRSNDPIQLWIEHKLANMKVKGALRKRIEYARKRSFKKPKGVDVVRFEEFAKIRHTWFFDPTRSSADPKSLWAYATDGGVYEEAFGIEGEIVSSWNETQFDETLLAILAYREIEERTSKIVKADRKQIWLRRLRYFALALFKIYCDELKLSHAELLSGRAHFDKEFSAFWNEAFRELLHAHHQAVVTDKTTVFALARSETRWNALRSNFATFIRFRSPPT
jgi:AIPR protein